MWQQSSDLKGTLLDLYLYHNWPISISYHNCIQHLIWQCKSILVFNKTFLQYYCKSNRTYQLDCICFFAKELCFYYAQLCLYIKQNIMLCFLIFWYKVQTGTWSQVYVSSWHFKTKFVYTFHVVPVWWSASGRWMHSGKGTATEQVSAAGWESSANCGDFAKNMQGSSGLKMQAPATDPNMVTYELCDGKCVLDFL